VRTTVTKSCGPNAHQTVSFSQDSQESSGNDGGDSGDDYSGDV
jgi:hypothetical protein